MSWIELHQSLPTNKKTIRLKNKLRIKTPQAVGHICMLWLWAVDNAPDGDLSGFTPDEISECAGWTGRSAEDFVEALVGSGFIDADMALHDWFEYAGRLLEHRAAQKEYKSRRCSMFSDLRVLKSVRSRDGDNCRFCGRIVNWKDRRGAAGGTYEKLDPDGADTAGNIVVSCRGCSLSRATGEGTAPTGPSGGGNDPREGRESRPDCPEAPTGGADRGYVSPAPDLRQIYGRKQPDITQNGGRSPADNICRYGGFYSDIIQKKPVITVPDRTIPDRTIPDDTVPDLTVPDRAALCGDTPFGALPDISLPGPVGLEMTMQRLIARPGPSPPGATLHAKKEGGIIDLSAKRGPGAYPPRDKNAALLESIKKGAGG